MKKLITLVCAIIALSSCNSNKKETEAVSSVTKTAPSFDDTSWDPEPSIPEKSFTPMKIENHFISNVLGCGYAPDIWKNDEIGCIAYIKFIDSTNEAYYLHLGPLTVIKGADNYSVGKDKVLKAKSIYNKILLEKASDLTVSLEGHNIILLFSKQNGFIWNKEGITDDHFEAPPSGGTIQRVHEKGLDVEL